MARDAYIEGALATLRARRDALDRAIQALEELDATPTVAVAITAGGGVSTHARPGRKRRSAGGGGADGVRRVLHASPGHGFTPEQLADAMLANGWETTADDLPRAARAAANRLKADPSERVYLNKGRFTFKPPNPFDTPGQGVLGANGGAS